MEQEGETVPWKKFFVHLAGKTNNAHQDFVAKFKRIGQKEKKSLEKCDYILVFCPIVSRVGTDIGEALESTPGGKPIILVVMHHTFNPDLVIAESRRLVKNQNVKLTVDCLIYEGELLKCHRNETAWSEVKQIFGVPEVDTPQTLQRNDQPALVMKQEGATGDNTNHQSTKTDNTSEPTEQSTSESSQQGRSGKVQGDNLPWKKFFIHLAGKTNNAHQDFVAKFKRIGQKEKKSLKKCDYILVFCPIVSRVGTDIGEALESAPGGKPIILVVMHHTFNPDLVIAESRRLVKNPNVKLTVDCLIYEGELLKCQRNETAWTEVKKIFKKSPRKSSSKVDTSQTSQRNDQPASVVKQEGATGENTNHQSSKTDNTSEPTEQSEQVRSGKSMVKGSSIGGCFRGMFSRRKRTSPSP